MDANKRELKQIRLMHFGVFSRNHSREFAVEKPDREIIGVSSGLFAVENSPCLRIHFKTQNEHRLAGKPSPPGGSRAGYAQRAYPLATQRRAEGFRLPNPSGGRFVGRGAALSPGASLFEDRSLGYALLLAKTQPRCSF
ncbi:MAG: hypothetical protein ABSE59_09960 [Opitutaceae bacterium]|jgi:hypothetical protein